MENSKGKISEAPVYQACQHKQGACTNKVFDQATEAVTYRYFRISFNEYLLSTMEDLVQIVHYREKLLTSLQVATADVAPLEDMQAVTWCALSRLIERHFERKAKMFDWSDDERREQELRLIRIFTPCWLMERRNEKLDIAVLKAWRDDLLELQSKVNHGESEDDKEITCRYCSENEDLVKENYVIQHDFNEKVNADDKKSSHVAGEFCLRESKERIGQENVDYACCMMDHLMSNLEFEPLERNALVKSAREHMLTIKSAATSK